MVEQANIMEYIIMLFTNLTHNAWSECCSVVDVTVNYNEFHLLHITNIPSSSIHFMVKSWSLSMEHMSLTSPYRPSYEMDGSK